MKRFNYILLLSVLIINLFPTFSYAKSEFQKEKVEFLTDIGILNGYEADKCKPDTKVTKGEFINAVLNFVQNECVFGDMTDENAVELAKSYGMIDKNERVTVTKSVQLEEAVEILMKAVGYYPLTNGGQNIKNTAQSMGLIKNISQDMKTELSLDTMITLLYNAVDAPYVVASFENGNYKIDDNSTLINKLKNIYTVRGIVRGNSYTTLTGDRTKKYNSILIDDLEVLIDDPKYNDYLGYNVEAWVFYDKSNDEYTLKYISNRNTETLEIKKKDIISADEAIRNISYEYNSRTRNIKLSPDVKVIYNGNAYTEYIKEDILNGDGSIFVIDNNGDKKYDVVIIWDYTTVVVDTVSKSNETIGNKYSYDENSRIIDLFPDDEDFEYVIYKDGIEISLADIKTGDVLMAAMPKTGSRRRMVIYASSDIRDLQINRVDDAEVLVYTDDEELTLSRGYSLAGEKKDTKFLKLKAGENYKLYLNVFGEVAYVEFGAKNVVSYGYITKLKYNERNDEYTVTLFGMDGAWHTLTLNEKATCDNYKSAGTIYSALTSEGKLIKPQMIRYKTNSKAEIKKIETATAKSEYDGELFTKTDITENEEYRTEVNAFVGSCIYLSSDAVVMLVPKDITEKNNFLVKDRSYFSNDEHICTVYDIDEWRTSSLVSVEFDVDKINTSQSDFFLVTKVRKAIDEDNEVCDEIVGYAYNYGYISLMGGKNTDISDIKKGDILQIATDVTSKIVKVKKVHSIDDYGTKYWTSSYNFRERTTALKGTVTGVNTEKGLFSVSCDNGKADKVLKMYDNNDSYYPFTATIYDRETEEVTNGNSYDICVGDYVVIDMSWYKVPNVVVYR